MTFWTNFLDLKKLKNHFFDLKKIDLVDLKNYFSDKKIGKMTS